MKQIDFSELFYEYFGDKPKSVHYELRQGPNLLHDVAFMSSLIHDARFYPNKVEHINDKIYVPLERDCWELGYSKGNELHIADSTLIISGVKRVDWDGISDSDKDEVWIDYLWISEDYRKHDSDFFDVILGGDDWRISITVIEYESDVVLQDTETPYLYSEKG